MLETISILPPAFWVVIALLAMGAVWGFNHIQTGIGLPMLAVLGTTSAWYVGDALYNDYAGDYAHNFSPAILQNAWWEAALFVVAFLVLAPFIHHLINARYVPSGSQVVKMLQSGAGRASFQFHLNQLFWTCVTVWAMLAVLAAIRLGSELPYYFFPFLGFKADPWGRGRIGGGIDALLSLAAYLQMFVAATCGIVAALAQNRRVRFLALLGCLLTWPYYIFDRTRNAMLVVAMPAILAWVFLRLRGGKSQKAVILATTFLLVNAWFGFVIANRSEMSIAAAVEQKGFSLQNDEDVHHQGLNMFEELCWINSFRNDGTFVPPWGQEYFAELANPIPRALWPGKPMIGLDYAVARGLAWNQGEGGVAATISTGMIGQGVVNFGEIIGPVFAALLMSLWAAGLARLDLRGEKVGRIPLFALGLILTFNLGRDITLITLYTFIFGSVIVWWLELRENSGRQAPASTTGNARRNRNKREKLRAGSEPGPFSVTSTVAAENDSTPKPHS